MGASVTTKMILALRSGGLCAMPECHCELVDDNPQRTEPAVVGEAAHIKGEKPDAERYDPKQTDGERNGHGNLIYLCPTCHTKIDKRGNGYSVQFLIDLKVRHEAWVLERLGKGVMAVGYAELEIACKAIFSNDITEPSDFTVINPKEKIDRNKLSGRTQKLIQLGLGRAKDVQGFLNNMTRFDSDFAERLRAGFVKKYDELKNIGFTGDELFDLMLRFAQSGSRDFTREAAGLAVLAYLFHACDVFEK